jgi:hypothetical protein
MFGLRKRKKVRNIAVKSKKYRLKMNLVMAVVVVTAARVLAVQAGTPSVETQVVPLRVTAGQQVLLDQRMAELVGTLGTAAMEETAAMQTQVL